MTEPVRGGLTARTARACETCRQRKVKCNGAQPCASCGRTQQDCIYKTRKIRGRKRVASKPSFSTKSREIKSWPPLEHHSGGVNIPPLLESTDPALLFQKQQELRAGIGMRNADCEEFQFFGASSHFCFLHRLYQRIHGHGQDSLLAHPNVGVPEVIHTWNLDKFYLDSHAPRTPSDPSSEIHFSREEGNGWIDAFFTIVHPQLPFLVYSEVHEIWLTFWEPPGLGTVRAKNCKDVVLLVLAIGAMVSSVSGKQDAQRNEKWAQHLADRVTDSFSKLNRTTLGNVHVLMLKAVFAWQIGIPSQVHLYLGHAARIALALGLNRSQVVQGTDPNIQRLRVTFWTLYFMERICALYVGRPPTLRDDHIDAPLAEDLLANDIQSLHNQANIELSYVRAMVALSRIADKIATGLYFPIHDPRRLDLATLAKFTEECDVALQDLERSVPQYLRFNDSSLPRYDVWRELQRAHFGLSYYLVRILLYSPALIYMTLFDSTETAERSVAGILDLKESVKQSLSSAKSLIDLARDVCMVRAPSMQQDGTVATFLLFACATLLHDVLDPKTTLSHARSTFESVESGITCLDSMQHIGPVTGKALSLEVMKCAKEALSFNELNLEEDLEQYFPWLNTVFDLPTDGATDSSLPLYEPATDNSRVANDSSYALPNFYFMTDWPRDSAFTEMHP